MADDLPPIDSSRSHLDILLDVLDMFEEYPPYRYSRHQDRECAECGYVDAVDSNDSDHLKHAEKEGGCGYLRSLAELQAWVRVEEMLKAERAQRELNGEPEPVSPAVLAERLACAEVVRAYAKPPAWIDRGAAEGIAQAILSRGNEGST